MFFQHVRTLIRVIKLISTIFEADSTNNSVNFVNNLAENESKSLLNEFFELKRRKK